MDIVIVPFYNETVRKDVLAGLREIDSRVFGIENCWKESNFLVDLPGKKKLSYIALSGNEIAGYLIGSAYKTDTGLNAHINRIATEPESSRKGTGRALIWNFEESAIELGCESVTLEFDSNLNVAGFYEKCGYHLLDQIKDIMSYVRLKNKERIAGEYTGFLRRIYKKDLLK